MGPHRRRHIFTLATLAAVAAGLIVAPAAMAGFFAPEDGGSPNADRINSLYWATWVIASTPRGWS